MVSFNRKTISRALEIGGISIVPLMFCTRPCLNESITSRVNLQCLDYYCFGGTNFASHFLQVDKEFTASWEAKVTPLAIAIFLKYSAGRGFKSSIICFICLWTVVLQLLLSS